MNRLEYHFDCLDGKYLCVCQFDDESLSYVIESSIKEEAVRFNKLLEEAQIENGTGNTWPISPASPMR